MLLRRTGDIIEAEGRTYRWRWSAETDEVTLADPTGRRILSHQLQPVVEVTGAPAAPGRQVGVTIDGALLNARYEGVNGGGAIDLTLRFLDDYYVLERVVYAPTGDEAIVRIALLDAAATDVIVVPGGRQDPEQAIFRTADLDDVTFSIGAFSTKTASYHQQWALPHYLVACYSADEAGAPTSGAACIGLGAVPDGNVLVHARRGRFAYQINFRGDLWRNRRGRAIQRFELPLVFAAASGSWHEAGLGYFEAALAQSYTKRKEPSAVPDAAFWPQYDTWGDQAARRCILHRFNEEQLRAIYADFQASGLNARLFVIDDKWEGVYGSLEHDPERFPHFPELLDQIRADGYEIGLWTAFPRCEDYRALGLTEDDLLVCPDGSPHVEQQHGRSWHLFDPTSARAAAHLRDRAHHLAHAYKPKLVKIDFGYEIPSPDIAGPHDPSWGGERLFLKFLEVIAGALRQADPQIAILYYCLSPLFSEYIDQCGMDDLWMSRGRYDEGFAKRALLSTWCGACGVVPYGSSGYDWRSATEIWFDSAVIGTPGVIAPLARDEYDERPAPDLVARYNGIARITRTNPVYRVDLLDADLHDPVAGPRARSWLRIEHGAAVVAALRPPPGASVAVPDLLDTDARVVVASLTDDGIATTSRLAIVPFSTGRVRLLRHSRGAPRAVAHVFGGTTQPFDLRIAADTIDLAVATIDAARMPIELIEVIFGFD
jgi:hypothetical protein